MALTIYGEARGESVGGQIAVANVIMNRWRNALDKYKTVRDVCLEPKQFSCWNKNDPNYPKLMDLVTDFLTDKGVKDLVLKQCLYIARGALGFNFLDSTKGSRYYMTYVLFNSDKRPNWAKVPITEPLRIGNHVFFNV